MDPNTINCVILRIHVDKKILAMLSSGKQASKKPSFGDSTESKRHDLSKSLS